MAEILFVRDAHLPIFYARRFSRVYPALLVFSLAMLATAGAFTAGPTPAQFVAAITFTLNYTLEWAGRSPVMDHIWSLCIEEHMYLLLGTVAFIHRARPLPLVPLFSIIAAIGMAWGLVETMRGADYYDVYWKTHIRGASLLLGVIAYLALADRRPRWLAWNWLPVILGLAGVFLHSYAFPDPVKYSIGTALLALSLVLMSNAPRPVLAILEHPLTTRVGIYSYSLYLWQQPFAKLPGTFADNMIHLALACGAALVSFYVVEQPARRALNQLIDRKIRRPSAAKALP